MQVDPVLSRQRYELDLTFRIQHSRALQLKQSWTVNIQDPAPLAFEALTVAIRERRNALGGIADRQALENRILQARAEEDLARPVTDEELRHAQWAILIESDVERIGFRKVLDKLVSAYNERTEGQKVFTTAEPAIRLGEQGAIFDEVISGVDGLMRSYCGRIRDEYAEEAKPDGFLAHPKIRKTWNGLVSSTLQDELSVIPHYGILHLPERMKSLAHHILPLLGHEAAHYWIDSIDPIVDTESAWVSNLQYLHLLGFDFYGSALCDETLLQAHEPCPSFGEFKAMGQQEKRAAARNAIAFFEDASTGWGEENGLDALPPAHQRWAWADATHLLHEVYCDIYAWLVAGPAFFLDLIQATDRPDREYFATRRRAPPSHPSDRTRLRIGCYLATAHPMRGTRNRWMVPLQKPGKEDWARIATAKPSTWNTLLAAELQKRTDGGVGPREDMHAAIPARPAAAYHQPTYALHAELADRVMGALNHGRHEVKLHEFLGTCLDPSPLFFDALTPDAMGDRFEYCLKIAETLCFGSNIVDGVSPRYVAAASTLDPIVRRPFFPSDKLYHSLFYSRDQPNLTHYANGFVGLPWGNLEGWKVPPLPPGAIPASEETTPVLLNGKDSSRG